MKKRPHEKDNGGTQLKTPYLDFLLPSIEKRKGKYLFRDRRCLCRPHEVFIRTEKEDLGKTLLAVNKSQYCNTKYNMQLIYRSKPRLCEIKFGSCNLIHISPWRNRTSREPHRALLFDIWCHKSGASHTAEISARQQRKKEPFQILLPLPGIPGAGHAAGISANN